MQNWSITQSNNEKNKKYRKMFIALVFLFKYIWINLVYEAHVE